MDSEPSHFWTFVMPTQHLHLGILILSLMCTKPRPWASPQTCFLNSVLRQFTSPLSWSALKPWSLPGFFSFSHLTYKSWANLMSSAFEIPPEVTAHNLYHYRPGQTTRLSICHLDRCRGHWTRLRASPFPQTPYAPRGSQSGPFKT